MKARHRKTIEKRKQLIQLTHSRFYNVRVLEGSTVSVRHVEQTIEGVNSILHCTLFFLHFAFQDDDSLPTQAPISSIWKAWSA